MNENRHAPTILRLASKYDKTPDTIERMLSASEFYHTIDDSSKAYISYPDANAELLCELRDIFVNPLIWNANTNQEARKFVINGCGYRVLNPEYLAIQQDVKFHDPNEDQSWQHFNKLKREFFRNFPYDVAQRFTDTWIPFLHVIKGIGGRPVF